MNTAANDSPHSQVPVITNQAVSPGILLETFQRHPLIILGTAILALVGAFVYLDRVTPLYTGTSRVYVEQEIKVIDDSEEGVMTRQDNYLYTQAEVILSNTVLSKALEALDTESMETFAEANSPRSVLQAGLEVEVGKTDGIINVYFKSPDPVEAAGIANAVVDAYIAFHAEMKRGATAGLLGLLEEALVGREADINEKYERLMAFRKQNENLAFGSEQNSNLIMRQMEKLLTQLSEAKLVTREAKHYYETAKSLAKDPVALRRVVEAWRLKNANYVPASKIVSPQPDQQFAQDQLGILYQEYMVAQQREKELTEQCEAQRQQVLLLNDQLAEYAQLEAVYEQAKKSSEMLEKRIDELSVTEDVGSLTITVLERALPTTVPSEPKKMRMMAIALLLGTCGGVGLGLLRTTSDKNFHSSREISSLLRLPVLGTIPVIRSTLRNTVLRARLVRICPTSAEAEAFRRLRTPILLSAFDTKAKTILVTSPVSGDGKTTVVSNLGLTLAQAGQKVLIVDADCRAPGQHSIFKKNRQDKGLSLVLTGQMSLDDAIEPTDTENLDILTCGPSVSNVAEMLNGGALQEVIATLATRYDRVVIDSAPVLSCTDTQVLATQCDGVVVVLRAEASTRKNSLQTCVELAGVGARILGVVVNGTPSKRDSYRYGGYYPRVRSIHTVTAKGGRVQSVREVPAEMLPAK